MGRKPRIASFDTPSHSVRVEPIVEPEPPVSVPLAGPRPDLDDHGLDDDEPLGPPA